MALEKNKVHHIFKLADTTVETWRDDLRNSLYAILIDEGWIKKEGEEFYSYPKDNKIKIQIRYNRCEEHHRCDEILRIKIGGINERQN